LKAGGFHNGGVTADKRTLAKGYHLESYGDTLDVAVYSVRQHVCWYQWESSDLRPIRCKSGMLPAFSRVLMHTTENPQRLAAFLHKKIHFFSQI